MDSPKSTKQNISSDETLLPKVNSTPKNHKFTKLSEEYRLCGLHRESSPNFASGHDVLEIGWGDSPEPLNMEQKSALSKTPVTCKKKLEIRESPRSSIPFKKSVRSTFSFGEPSKQNIDIAKYVAEVQELSKNIMKEFSVNKLDNNSSDNDSLNNCTQSNDINLICNKTSTLQEVITEDLNIASCTSSNLRNQASGFDSVLQSFINEEDEWLSQALFTQEAGKNNCKGNFIKSRSENELSLPQTNSMEKKTLTQNFRNINNNLRRTSSFDMTRSDKKSSCIFNNNIKIGSNSKSISVKKSDDNPPSFQYSLQEIENKRLEAKFRRERREIERKKLEALRKLEMKKLRTIKT